VSRDAWQVTTTVGAC